MTAMIDEMLWRLRAACKHAPPGLFISDGDDDDEPDYPPKEASRYCAFCPVRVDCLTYALNHHDVVGVWGGTTTYMRNQINRKRSRLKCPGCGADDMIVGQGQAQELCIACGTSWYIY